MKSHKRRRTLIKPTTKPMARPSSLELLKLPSFLLQFSSSLCFSLHLSERRNATGDCQRSFSRCHLIASPDFRWRDVFMTFALFLHSFIRISHSDQTTQSVSNPLVLLLTFSGCSRYHMHRTRAVDSVHGVCIELSPSICFGQCALR